MRFLRLAEFLLILLVGASGGAADSPFVPGRILVRPKAGLSETNLVAKLKSHHVLTHKNFRRFNVRVVTVPEETAETALAALQKDPDIEFAERDYIARAAFLPNDPSVVSSNEWHLSRIQADQAWNITTGASNVIVAVLDSGIDRAHPDLAGQALPGYDFVNNDEDPTDDFGHGTAVSGTVIAAGNNGIGVAGVAYGCRLLPVKVMDASGFAAYSCIAQGIEYAVDHGARVINISIAGSSPSLTLQDAIDDAWSNNVVIVAAAGNNANDDPQYPAACDHVIGVSATEPDDSLAGFSSYGNEVTLSAPGDNIWTTQNDVNNPYGAWRGTSFASPVVAGVAALVASENPSLSNTRIVSLLEQTADDVGAAGYDTSFGYGRVNASAAVQAACLEPGALPAASPPVSGTTNTVAAFGMTPQPPSSAATQSPGNGTRFAAPVAGCYIGLVVDVRGVLPDDSGLFRLAVTPAGRFTGRLWVGGRGYGFHGMLDLAGDATVTVKRGRLNPLTLALHLDLTNGTDQVTGSVTAGGWTSGLWGDRNVFNAKLNPALQAGTHAFVLERAEDTSVAAATGLSAIARSGTARIKGKLNGGHAFSIGSLLARNGDCPFYLSLNRGTEVVVGWLNFPATQTTDASGTVLWVQTGTNAFAATLRAAAAP